MPSAFLEFPLDEIEKNSSSSSNTVKGKERTKARKKSMKEVIVIVFMLEKIKTNTE